VELHHLTEYLSAKLRVYFLTSPKYRPFWFWSDLIARSQLATAQCKQDASAAESGLLFDHLVGAGEDRLRHDQPEQRRSSALGKAQTTLFAKPAVTNPQVCRRIGFLPRLSLGPLAVAGREKRRAVEGSSGAAQSQAGPDVAEGGNEPRCPPRCTMARASGAAARCRAAPSGS
jgi:hypothetical protein